jgi:hypothetical protein
MDEDQRLDDLAELHAHRRGSFCGGMGRLVEDRDLEAHPFSGGNVANALDRGLVNGLGHGAENSTRSGDRGGVASGR